MHEILSKEETTKLKKLINLKNQVNLDNIFHLNLDDKIIVLIPVKKNFKINILSFLERNFLNI